MQFKKLVVPSLLVFLLMVSYIGYSAKLIRVNVLGDEYFVVGQPFFYTYFDKAYLKDVEDGIVSSLSKNITIGPPETGIERPKVFRGVVRHFSIKNGDVTLIGNGVKVNLKYVPGVSVLQEITDPNLDLVQVEEDDFIRHVGGSSALVLASFGDDFRISRMVFYTANK